MKHTYYPVAKNFERHSSMTYRQKADLIRAFGRKGYGFKLRTMIWGFVHSTYVDGQRLNPVAARVAFICLAQRVLQ